MTDAKKYEIAINMLAYWVYLVQKNGTGWDDWDDGYKDAAYRDVIIRNDLDMEIARIHALDKREE